MLLRVKCLGLAFSMRSIVRSLLFNSRKNVKANVNKIVSVLNDITKERLIVQGAILHGHLIKTGISSQKHIAVKLLIMYLKSGKSKEIDQMLKEFDGFNLVVHNCLITVNLEWGKLDEARRLFDEMPDRNEVSWTAIISGFMRFGRVDEAIFYFERNPFQTLFAWTATISGLVQNGLSFKAMKLFVEMLQSGVMPNNVTFTSVIRACGELSDFYLGACVLGLIVKVGFEHDLSVSNSLITFNLRLNDTVSARRIFDRMQGRDVVSWTAILDMYVQKGDLTEARRVFDEMPERNEVSWSTMISRYSQSGDAEAAVNLFHCMVQQGYKPNKSCLASVVSALSSLEALITGRIVHGHILKIGIEKDAFIGSSLVDLYCKCGSSKDGRVAFDSILEKNVVCWNSMVSGYSLNNQLEEAKELFDKIPQKNSISWNSLMTGYLEYEKFDEVFEGFSDMLLSGEQPNKSTFSSVLCACASLASLERGKNLHGKVIKLGFHSDVFVDTALLDMYAKSGNVESSKKIFKRMPKRNEISWTAMIQGLAENGFADEALTVFEEFEWTKSIAPNELILLAVLFACSHCGLVDKGLHYFNSMEKVYNIQPNARHYTCVVDMLSRSGRLSEAEKFILDMPCEPEVQAWAALLSGCKTYRNERMTERVAKKISELAEKHPEGYVLLSNVYASAGRWLDVLHTRKEMKEKGLKKSGGCSWIEVRNQLHSFYSQDGSHNESTEIYEVLELLRSEMQLI
ncbi:pentatricopeptide repeat-containing protein At1g31430-like [Nicotiana tabacum]|uniref:pentatricopeptide repeat-containing protein At1g31430-like n=1 Tax=Nicotiana tabacum TaxID=4097 RepID=UPI003F4EA99E